MNLVRKLFLLLLVILVTITPGCYTLLGTVMGPLTGPYDWDKYLSSQGLGGISKVFFFIHAPFLVLGPLTGMYKGILCDIEFLRNLFGDKEFKLPDTSQRRFNIWRPFTSTYGFYDKVDRIR